MASNQVETPPSSSNMAGLPQDKEPHCEGHPKFDNVEFSFSGIIGTEMVDLYVGQERRHFRVHKHLLCNKVPYFRTMFLGGFKEATENSATFPEDRPESYEVLMNWIYTGSLPTIQPHLDYKPAIPPRWDILYAYVLADKLCLPYLCDEIMDRMLHLEEKMQVTTGIDSIGACYRESPPGSAMRKYAAHLVYYLMMEEKNGWQLDLWPTEQLGNLMISYPDLLQDFLGLVREGASNLKTSNGRVLRPYELPRCHFHCHFENQPCYTVFSNKGFQIQSNIAWVIQPFEERKPFFMQRKDN